MTILISIGIFLTVILFIEGSVYAYHAFFNPKNKAMKRRLRGTAKSLTSSQTPEQAELLKKKLSSGMPWVDSLLTKLPRVESLEKTLVQANSNMPLGVFIILSLVLAGAGCVFAAVSNSSLWGMLLSTIGSGLFAVSLHATAACTTF